MTAEITKVRIDNPQKGLYFPVVNLYVDDDGKEAINKEYSYEYRPGDVASGDVMKAIEAVRVQMQDDIEKYKVEKAGMNDPDFDSLVTLLKQSLVL